MNTIHTLSLGLLLALASAGHARAEAVPTGTFVYYGSAEFAGSSAGLTVGPYASAFDCQTALDAAIDNAVDQGYQIESVSPCIGHWAFSGGVPEREAAPYTLAVLADSPGESGGIAHVLLDEVAAARKTFQIDRYEATLQAISRAAITDPLRKKDHKDR
ncbi:MAG: hypothetical protein ACTHOH_19020 [Lysobacteraceae bacterium]